MADPQIAAPVTPAPSAGPAQPAPVQADDGFERIPRDELQNLRRNNERVRGMEGFFQEAGKRGFKRPEDFGSYDKFSGVLKSKNLTMDQLATMLGQEDVQDGKTAPGFSPADMEKFLSEKGYLTREAVTKEFTVRDALGEHQKRLEAEQAWLKGKFPEILGDKASDWDREALEAVAYRKLQEARQMYPDGHPLRDRELAAYDDATLGKHWDAIKGAWTKSKGGDLAAKGAAVNNGARTVAGAAGTSAPKTEGGDDKEPAIGTPEHRKQVERALAARVAARQAGPVSASG